ncbi:hypothetical protein THAOC_09671 [Thalassiosira oceanica]|uniref:Uncharacterized protein n=1 Tax=Thalassiosira oceanica TaxID=159749 RepID=K0SUM0_THAOC|nr:hypothetical protein THAOC_09671 [Thalassiosira oceanica]|eukprot:EJK69110.1 hypothetical protein THAOC_09671 [Thalassiosira oceanica]
MFRAKTMEQRGRKIRSSPPNIVTLRPRIRRQCIPSAADMDGLGRTSMCHRYRWPTADERPYLQPRRRVAGVDEKPDSPPGYCRLYELGSIGKCVADGRYRELQRWPLSGYRPRLIVWVYGGHGAARLCRGRRPETVGPGGPETCGNKLPQKTKLLNMPGLSASEMIRQRQSRLSSTAAAGQSPGRQRQRQQPSSAGSTADLTATARDAILGGSPPNEQDDRARSRGEDEPPSQPTPTDPVSAKKDARNLSEESETERQGPSHDRPTLQEGECGDTAVGDSSLPLLTTGPSPLPSTKSQSGHSESSHLAIPTNSIRSSLDRPDALTPRSRTADESGTANFTDRLVGRRHNTSLQQNDDGLVTSAASVSSGMSAAWRSSRASCDDGTEVAGHAVVDEAASKTLAIPAGGGIDGEDEQDEHGESEPQGSAIDVDGVGGQDVIDDSRPDEADVEAPNNEAGQDVGAEAVATKTSLVVIDGVTVKVNDDAPLASIGRSHDDGQDLNDESKRALPWYKRPCGKIFIVLVAGAVIAAGLLAKRPWESSTPRADEVGQGSENETVNDPSHAQNETIAIEPEVTSPELVSYSTAAPSISAIPITQSTNRPTASLEQVRPLVEVAGF